MSDLQGCMALGMESNNIGTVGTAARALSAMFWIGIQNRRLLNCS